MMKSLSQFIAESSFGGEHVLQHFKDTHHEHGQNPEMEKYIKNTKFKLTKVHPDKLPSEESLWDKDDPFHRVVDIDYDTVKKNEMRIDAGKKLPPIIMGKGAIIDGHHRALAAKNKNKHIDAYVPVEKD